MTGHDEGETDSPPGRERAASPAAVERLAERLAREGRPFARVTVVRREAPVSANVGDRAVVTAEDGLVGWVGGAGCAQSVAEREARAAIESGEPKLIGLAPDPATVDRPGLEAFPMTCHSGGTVELFVEPVNPAPRVVVVGDSPIARSLVDLSVAAGETVVAVPCGETDAFAAADEVLTDVDAAAIAAELRGADDVVVASMGACDERGVAAAVDADVGYLGLVASDRRGAEVAAAVAARLGVDEAAVAGRITTPAGIDIGARTPPEIAVSILAEVVATRRAGDGEVVAVAVEGTDGHGHGHDETAAPEADADGGTVVDPVCGMDVVPADAAATVEYEGDSYHFCGQGCADAFAADPTEYLGDAAGEA